MEVFARLAPANGPNADCKARHGHGREGGHNDHSGGHNEQSIDHAKLSRRGPNLRIDVDQRLAHVTQRKNPASVAAKPMRPHIRLPTAAEPPSDRSEVGQAQAARSCGNEPRARMRHPRLRIA